MASRKETSITIRASEMSQKITSDLFHRVPAILDFQQRFTSTKKNANNVYQTFKEIVKFETKFCHGLTFQRKESFHTK